MNKKIIVVAITLALTGIQAEAASNKDKYKDVTVYGNVTLEQDSMSEWGPWAQFIQPAAGAPVPPPVAAAIVDPIPEIREPVIPEPPVATGFCEPGSPCGYASYRYSASDYTTESSTSGGGAPARMVLTSDMTGAEGPITGSFQVTTTRARDDYAPASDNYSPVTSVAMNGYQNYDGSFGASGYDSATDRHSYIGGNSAASPATYSGYWHDGAESGQDDRFGDYVYGITTSQEGLDTLNAGNVEAHYDGYTLGSHTHVVVTANFGDGTWNASWNGGHDGTISGTHTDSHGVAYVDGQVGFNASGNIDGVNLTANSITATDGIIDQGLSTVEMSIFGDSAQTLEGVQDITKTVEPRIDIEGSTNIAYENARNVDVIVADRVYPQEPQ